MNNEELQKEIENLKLKIENLELKIELLKKEKPVYVPYYLPSPPPTQPPTNPYRLPDDVKFPEPYVGDPPPNQSTKIICAPNSSYNPDSEEYKQLFGVKS